MNDRINNLIHDTSLFLYHVTSSSPDGIKRRELEDRVDQLFTQFSALIQEYPQLLSVETSQHIYSALSLLRATSETNDLNNIACEIEKLMVTLKNTLEKKPPAPPLVAHTVIPHSPALEHTVAPRSPVLELNADFLCDPLTYQETLPFMHKQMLNLKTFDTQAFLRGPKGRDPAATATIDALLEKAVLSVQKKACAISEIEEISLESAYKMLIGAVDQYDDEALQLYAADRSTSPQSSFALRSAILLASQQDGLNLESWMVYTKSGKPDPKNLWGFLDNWKNWVPEAQGAMAKFSEEMIVKAAFLAKKHQEGKVILLKGGYGAGKTRLVEELVLSEGTIAPDSGKKVVRRAMGSVTHSSAHVQGSQLAFRLFSDMIQNVKGTVVYDSSLKNSKDIENYLQQAQMATNKKLVIYDVARNDMARALSVLKRNVEGEDPRIPPDSFIASAVHEKLTRVTCMQVILNHKAEHATHAAEYHFRSGDSQGWNTEEMMIIGSNNQIKLTSPLAKERLALEGLEFDEITHTLKSTLSEKALRAEFENNFKKPVREVLSELSAQEQATLQATFANRTLSQTPLPEIRNALELYKALPASIQSAISVNAFQEAFYDLGIDVRQAFFASLKGKSPLSYLDLPLRAAFIIHQNLNQDPWKAIED